jgi:hypothetical protein
VFWTATGVVRWNERMKEFEEAEGRLKGAAEPREPRKRGRDEQTKESGILTDA